MDQQLVGDSTSATGREDLRPVVVYLRPGAVRLADNYDYPNLKKRRCQGPILLRQTLSRVHGSQRPKLTPRSI